MISLINNGYPTKVIIILLCLSASCSEPSPFRIVIDAGSTGSRLHIFEFINNDDGNVECIRRGSSKAWVKLSAFANDNKEKPLNATHVAHHMLNVFEYASIIIPLKYHSSTPVRIAATAGMRLLSTEDQAHVYDALHKGLLEQVDIGRFTFTALKREDIMTLDGDREAFFGAVSANYLKGVVDAQLRVIVSDELDYDDKGLCTNKFGMCEEHAENILRIPNKKHNEAIPLDDRGICTNKFKMCELDAEDVIFGSYISQNSKHDVKKHGVLGALDMGGSSTQIVYRHTTDRISRKDETIVANESSEDDLMMDIPSHLKDEEFFSTSYLSYGADQFRVRLWDLWISEAQEKDSIDDDDPIILNPCSFVGYQMVYKRHKLLGTGNSILCAKEINRLIPHHDNVIDLDELYDDNMESTRIKEQVEANGKMVGGIKHPPVTGKYMAMSLYFFTLDCLRELSDNDHPINVHWPTPTIDELKHALESFCARSWKDDLEEVQHEAHEYTMAEILPHRCLEAVYMVTLMEDGFGFHPSKRDITFTHKVDGNEVEWSLGLALSEYAAEKEE